ncbi:MAG: adenylyltransferase/cytidyltransferase family protein [Patescibacteria group bacterium]
MNKLNALFIGRFQPFHLGHLSVVEQLARDINIGHIIIGVGSSQYHSTLENPYTFKERETIINACLTSRISKTFSVCAIPDIHNAETWVNHVKALVENFDVVYTGNNWVKSLFDKKNVPTHDVEFKVDITGTKLRQMIFSKNNKEWKKYVCSNSINLIQNAKQRFDQENQSA